MAHQARFTMSPGVTPPATVSPSPSAATTADGVAGPTPGHPGAAAAAVAATPETGAANGTSPGPNLDRPIGHHGPIGANGPPVRSPVDGPSAAAGMRRLVTAEAVELEIPTASVGLRMLALVLDLVVIVGAILMVAWGTFKMASRVRDIEAILLAAIAVTAATPFITTWVMEGLTNGRSLGKAVAGLQVVTIEGGPIGWKHAGIRAAFATFEIWLTFGFLAMVTALVSSRGQRLGDMAAGTLVVRSASRSMQVTATRFRTDPAIASLIATLDVSDLSHSDYQVMRSALVRTGLDPDVHAQLCGDVVRSLWPRIASVALPTTVPAPIVLTGIATAFQDLHGASQPGTQAGEWVWQSLSR